MRHRAVVGTFGALACAVLLWSSGKARADEVVTADLETKPTGGIHAMMPQKVKLSPTKPASVTREPAYSGQPSYGVLTLGDAKNNQIVVALVPGKGENSPHLFVDSNGDGDLTNDPPVTLASASASPTTDGQHASSDTQTQPGAAGELRAVVPVTVRYNLTGRAGQVESTLEFTLLGSDLYVNREYSREGKITLNGRPYRVALVDQGVDGRFDVFKHEEDDPPRVTLLIDRSNTGHFNLRRDAFDAAKPFRLGAAVYEVTSINVRGTHLTLQKSNKHVRGTVTAADLKVGNDAIDFDAETTDSKTVHFPDDYSGKIVLLDFWATWDPNSRSEVPYLVSAYRTYHDRGFDILGVSLDQTNQQERVIGFARQFGMVWPEVYDGQYVNAEVARLYDIRALPSLFLVDGDTGQVLAMGKALVSQGLVGAIEQALQNRKTR